MSYDDYIVKRKDDGTVYAVVIGATGKDQAKAKVLQFLARVQARVPEEELEAEAVFVFTANGWTISPPPQ